MAMVLTHYVIEEMRGARPKLLLNEPRESGSKFVIGFSLAPTIHIDLDDR